MNGIKYIREKSNFTKNALAERMGVTRQTIGLWENGVRRPDSRHLKWLCDFYGIEEKWFGELSEEDIDTLNQKKMYRHFDGDKEYFSFIPENDGFHEISIECGELDSMLDERYANVLKKKRDFMVRVEDFLEYSKDPQQCLYDKITNTERGMRDIDDFLDLMAIVQLVGHDGRFLKVPFRYEIKAVLYAMMVASGHYTKEEMIEAHPWYFEPGDCIYIDSDYFDRLIDLMSGHWNNVRDHEMDKRAKLLEGLRKRK